jgi:superfamily II DNA helicase RecQ
MAVRFFTVPVHDSAAAEAELNALLARYRIVAVERRFVDQGVQSFWAICVDYIVSNKDASSAPVQRERIDYKEKLSAEQFKQFAQLRDLRKDLAQAEGVPVYAIFTNEQLAKMVVDRTITQTALAQIDGVGAARVEKYGKPFLKRLSELLEPPREA